MTVPPRSAPPIALPHSLASERGVLLHRALRELPVALLEPMLSGIRRHADALTAGALFADGGGGCAVGAMLREIGERSPAPGEAPSRGSLRRFVPRRLRFQSPTVSEARPDLARANPRLAHLELIFDVTCTAMIEQLGLDPGEAARSVGLWMAAETQAEINLRHVEISVEHANGAGALPAVALDRQVFHETVDRLRQLRPWLTEGQAGRLLEEWVGARRVELDPLFVPDDWAAEVRLQRRRLDAGVQAARQHRAMPVTPVSSVGGSGSAL